MPDFDVIIIGGGPAGATLGSLLGLRGRRALVLEKDIHPRDHVGESLTPSTNPIFKEIGFLEKIEQAGFVHKPGACWTAPRTPVGGFLSIRLGEFPPPGATQLYTYNVERDLFDAMLLRHAYESGASVLQGARAASVLFEGDRAVGVRVALPGGWERDLTAPLVVDASGRRCLIATQLRLKRNDPDFNQFVIFSWFRGVEPNPPGTEGMIFLHFLDLDRSWTWQIPMRDGLTSVGAVTTKQDFQKSGRSPDEFFESLLGMNQTLAHNMRGAERVRPWWIEADYSYLIDQLTGPGWLLIGDALRFVDPVFSTGVDVAMYSARFAFDAIETILDGEDEAAARASFEARVGPGVEAWYDLIRLFYDSRNLFTMFGLRKRFREQVVRILQGNLYLPETLERARTMIGLMRRTYATVESDPDNLLRFGVLKQRRATENGFEAVDRP